MGKTIEITCPKCNKEINVGQGKVACPECSTIVHFNHFPNSPTHEISTNWYGRVVVTCRGTSAPEVLRMYHDIVTTFPKEESLVAKEEKKIDQFAK